MKTWMIIFFLLFAISKSNDIYAAHNYLLAMNADMEGLHYTGNDRRRIVSALRKHFNGNISVRQINNVTRSKYHQAMQSLIRSVRNDDYVIIYFSGHGTQVIDRNGDELDHLDEALITYHPSHKVQYNDILLDDEFSYDIKQLSAKYITVILDTCHAGGMYKNYSNRASRRLPKYIYNPRLSQIPPRDLLQEGTLNMRDGFRGILFAASSENELAIEDSNIKGSIFTAEFSLALRQHNNIEHAFYQARNNVIERTERRQTPKKSIYK